MFSLHHISNRRIHISSSSSPFRFSSPVHFRSPWIQLSSSPPVVNFARLSIRCCANDDDKDNYNTKKKPASSICTADELHYVPVSLSDWNLALWRYKPPPSAPPRNHPLVLLSGVGTNAIGFDLAPESSFARYMSNQGFDTWILELRGAGLSHHNPPPQSINTTDDVNPVPIRSDNSQLFKNLNGRSIERKPSSIASQIRDLSEYIVNMIKGQQSTSTTISPLQDFQKQLDLIIKYNWDFDHYLEEDVPAAMEYIRNETKPQDGKLLAIGHSMGGILLYAMLSRHGFSKRDSGLASILTLGSSLDYASSNSSLKILLPLVDPGKALSVPVVPLGALLAAAHPIASRAPYILPWLNPLISATDMMHPELLQKLVSNNFGTVPTKLLNQLATAFGEGGLCDRKGTFFYKEHLPKSNVPILAIAGDQDLICPPEAVYETIKRVPKDLIGYKVFGKSGGPHYGHYDLVGGRLAAEEVYPCMIEFLSKHDSL